MIKTNLSKSVLVSNCQIMFKIFVDECLKAKQEYESYDIVLDHIKRDIKYHDYLLYRRMAHLIAQDIMESDIDLSFLE